MYCVFTELKLYIVHVYGAFSKVCDRLPRAEMMGTLKPLGCGAVMLAANRVYV